MICLQAHKLYTKHAHARVKNGNTTEKDKEGIIAVETIEKRDKVLELGKLCVCVCVTSRRNGARLCKVNLMNNYDWERPFDLLGGSFICYSSHRAINMQVFV